jgi:pre-mRNA-splicing factor ISY1
MLFRFRQQQAADLGILDISRTRRPKVITSIDSIPVCEKWRGQVLKEISRKVSKIQDPSLSDYQIRDLNDEINKLMREKHMWEVQIRTLGGPNYTRGGRVVDEDGKEIPGGGKGYRYFGRARELPGVKELFEAASKPDPKEQAAKDGANTRAALSRMVDAAYYGYLDEEDGTLLTYEKELEERMHQRFIEETEQEESDNAKSATKKRKVDDADNGWQELPGDTGDGVRWRMPTIQEVHDEILERKKRAFLDKLSS